MKKKAIFLLLFLILIGFSYKISTVNSQAGGTGIGLTLVDSDGPIINIANPLNNSGSSNENITFFFNVSDASNIDNCSLIINNKVNRTERTITKDAPILLQLNNTGIGLHNWSINCTDSLGFVGESETRAFTHISILTSNFNGTITNLSSVAITNVTNFTIGVVTYGEISFINSTGGLDLSQGFDLNKYINISFNNIEINVSNLTIFNRSASLQLVGLAFSNPRIVKDGIVCPETICKKISYSGGVLTFNVSHFTVYSSEETPSSGDSGSSGGASGGGGGGGGGAGGGGGGGGSAPISTDFISDKASLKVVLRQGQTKEETLGIKNIGTTIFDVTAYLQGIERFVTGIKDFEIQLEPNEEKTIKFVFKASESEKPDIYTGKIVLKGPSSQKEVNALIEVDSAEPLFDVDVEVLSGSKRVFPGEELILEVNLFNVRGFGRVDVFVDYFIKDFDGNVLATESETLAVETQAKFTRRILIPSDLKPGTYVIFAKVNYADSIGTSSDLFEVKARTIRLYPIKINDYKSILLVVGLFVLVISIFIAYRFSHKKKESPKTEIEEIKEFKDEGKAQKLEKELKALESAYKSGFISEESYQKERKRVEDKLSKLK